MRKKGWIDLKSNKKNEISWLQIVRVDVRENPSFSNISVRDIPWSMTINILFLPHHRHYELKDWKRKKEGIKLSLEKHTAASLSLPRECHTRSGLEGNSSRILSQQEKQERKICRFIYMDMYERKNKKKKKKRFTENCHSTNNRKTTHIFKKKETMYSNERKLNKRKYIDHHLFVFLRFRRQR